MDKDLIYMKLALKEAQKAYDKLEVPIGAVIVYKDKVIAKAHNSREKSNQTIGHAEILAISKANKKLDTWRLEDCTLYVTLEPCPMCAGAIIQSRIKRVVYGAKDKKNGSHVSITNLFDLKFNHIVEVENGLMENECSNMLKSFFKELRKK